MRAFGSACAALAVVSLLSGCGREAGGPGGSPATQYMKNLAIPTPSPSPPPQFRTFTFGEALAPGGPALTSEQRAWIRRISHSRWYGPLRSKLRFVIVQGSGTPVVAYVDVAEPEQADHGGHIIGESCNSYFDPVAGGLFTASEVSCSPPTPKPV